MVAWPAVCSPSLHLRMPGAWFAAGHLGLAKRIRAGEQAVMEEMILGRLCRSAPSREGSVRRIDSVLSSILLFLERYFIQIVGAFRCIQER